MHDVCRFSLLTAAVALSLLVSNPSKARAQAITDFTASPCVLSVQWQADGDAAGDYFGFSVDGNADLSGDGRPDILVGAMLGDIVYGYYVNPLGMFERGVWWNGNSGSDFGRSVRFLGVPDNFLHGTASALIGAPGHTAPGTDSCGYVTERGRDNMFGWIGSATGEKLGYSVGNVGDLDGDGFDEVIAGAPEAAGPLGPRAGYALLLSPYPGNGYQIHRFERGVPNELFGRAVAGAGDVDGDGARDVLIGAPYTSQIAPVPLPVGAAYVYRTDGTVIWTFYGETPGDYFGNSVANAGDVNADGHPDILVGAWLADVNSMPDAGAAYVYSGADGSLLYKFVGEGPSHCFGYSVRGLGDIDADGYDDFIIGAHRADLNGTTDGGAVYVYSGRLGNYLWIITGIHTDDIFGVSAAAAGDMTLDGRPDFIVGAFGTDPGGRVNAGSAFLFGCPCNCAYNGDPAHDGITDVRDVVITVGVAFRGTAAEQGVSCRYQDPDVNCSGSCDVVDVVKMVNVAFRGAEKATEFCNGCQ